MARYPAPGLPADWLNAWLAAIGVTVLFPETRLAWSGDVVPYAVFDHTGRDLPGELFDRLPTVDDLAESPIARHLPNGPELKRNVTLEAFQQRARRERTYGRNALASTVTDLTDRAEQETLPHSPFDVPVPRGLTLWERAVACREAIPDSAAVAATLNGRGQRVTLNGLGFDVRRIDARAENITNMVLPTVEMLAFAALDLFPVRGDGRRDRTRGWTGPALRKGAFTWGTWSDPLDRWAIDTWLDRFHADERPRAGSRFATVPYQPTGSSDVTRAYATERLA